MLGMENKWFMTLCALLGQVHHSVMWLDKVFSILRTLRNLTLYTLAFYTPLTKCAYDCYRRHMVRLTGLNHMTCALQAASASKFLFG